MLKTSFIPACQHGSKRLTIVLHGLGDSIEGYRFLPSALAVSDMNYLLVNAPDEYFGGFAWYDLARQSRSGVERSRLELEALLERQAEAGFAPEKTFLFGFSQGCLMTMETGLRYPHRLAGLIGISGYVLDAPTLVRDLSPMAKNQRILWTHGTKDPILPVLKVKEQTVQLRSAGLDIEWREFNKAHTIAGEEELAVVRTFMEK
ncbi:MAG: serine esterase [Verrucomicrobia bacterium]|nr:serine esterase [Verrucomicrobiota bacterium]